MAMNEIEKAELKKKYSIYNLQNLDAMIVIKRDKINAAAGKVQLQELQKMNADLQELIFVRDIMLEENKRSVPSTGTAKCTAAKQSYNDYIKSKGETTDDINKQWSARVKR